MKNDQTHRLDTETAKGLTDAQVEERRKTMGFNELESSVSSLRRLPHFLPPERSLPPLRSHGDKG